MRERLQTLFWIFCGGWILVVCFFLAGKVWRARCKSIPTVYMLGKPSTNSFRLADGTDIPITEKYYNVDPSGYISNHKMESDIQSIRWKVEFGSFVAPEIVQISIFDTNRVWAFTSKNGIADKFFIFSKKNGKWDSVKSHH